MLEHAKEDWMKVLGESGASRIREDTDRFFPEYQRLGDRIICNLIGFLKLS